MLQSSDPDKEAWAQALNSCFLNKNSFTLGAELSSFFYQYLGFGDFIFRDQAGAEIARAANMEDLREKLRIVPIESVLYHASRNHFSAWLMARGEVEVAQVVLRVKPADYSDLEDLRAFLINMGDYIQRLKSRGKVVPFTMASNQEEFNVLRLADGALGGKARGVAFLNNLLEGMDLEAQFPEANVRIPRSFVVGTEEFQHLHGTQRPARPAPGRGQRRHHQAPLPHGQPVPRT